MLGNCADTIAPWYRKISTLPTHARSRTTNVDRFINLATRGIKMLNRRLDFLKTKKLITPSVNETRTSLTSLCERHFKTCSISLPLFRPKWGPKGPKNFFLSPATLLSQGLDDRAPALSEGLGPPLTWVTVEFVFVAPNFCFPQKNKYL